MAITSAKFLGRSSSSSTTLTSGSVENISIIATKLVDVDTILKGSLLLDKIRDKKKRQAEQRRKRNQKESAREKMGALGKGIKEKAMSATAGMRDWLNRLVMGALLITLVKLAPLLEPMLPWIQAFVAGAMKIAEWVFKGTVTLIHWAYKAYDGLRGFVKNIFGEEGVKKFDTLMGNLNTLFNAAFMAAMALLKFKWLRKFAKNILKPKRLLRTIGVKFRRFIGPGGRKVVAKVGAKVGGFAAKIFGKAANVIAPAFKASKGFISKFFGKIPIIGPLVVGIVSLLSGEPAAQALFKAVGAALGGLLGSFIPIPIIGTLIGETIGVFVGDLLYTLMFGGGVQAVGQKLKDTFKTFIQPIFDFFTNGFKNFTENFPTFDVPDVGLQDLYIPILEKMGLKGMLDFRIPGKVGPFRVPFIPKEGFSLRDMLNTLPKLPDILGWVAKIIPPLQTYVQDGRLMKLPQIWQLFNPIFMVKHLAQSFLPQWFGGSSSEKQSTSVQEARGGDKDVEEKEVGIIENKLVAHLRMRHRQKQEEQEKAQAEAVALKEAQKSDITKGIEVFMQKPFDAAPSVVTDSSASAEGTESYPSYESAAGQTAMIPLPPQVIPVGEQSKGVASALRGGGGDDPFEGFYAHPGGLT
jgi:uncharacterized protein YqgC (DUF456 family)